MCSACDKKERWLPTSIVMRELGVSRGTVLALIESGRLDRVRDISTMRQPRYQIEKGALERYKESIILPH
jgi:hypothetical protein